MLLSHPLRVRGLKLQFQHACLTTVYVASFTGAWIETPEAYSLVTPKVSHPLRVRGLKRFQVPLPDTLSMSHPLRVRGLKHLSE